jgi:hypothetical protein
VLITIPRNSFLVVIAPLVLTVPIDDYVANEPTKTLSQCFQVYKKLSVTRVPYGGGIHKTNQANDRV